MDTLDPSEEEDIRNCNLGLLGDHPPALSPMESVGCLNDLRVHECEKFASDFQVF